MKRAAVLLLLTACATPPALSAPPPQAPPSPEFAPPPEVAPPAPPPATAEPAPPVEPETGISTSAIRLRHAAVDLGENAPQSSGEAPTVAGPSVAMGPVHASVPISNAERVIAGLRASFRRCYAQALKRDPNMSGAAGLDMKIGPTGEVTSASVTGKGLSPDLVKCLSAATKRAQFAPPPGGGTATIVVPFTMTR